MGGPLDSVSLGPLLPASAVDAAQGQRTQSTAERAAAESEFEPLDQLLLRRLRNQPARSAATSVSHAADAAALADRIRELAGEDPASLRRAQGDLDRTHLRHLLGG